jgi:type II secretory pathway pseudopilin PulG
MKLKAKNKYFISGMTLIELIVSMGIIVFITAIFVANYRSANKRTDLIMASQSLVSDFHRAQNNALGLLKYGDEVPAGGWGVSFNLNNKTQYVVFADLQPPGASGYMEYGPGEGDIPQGARIVQLPPVTEISALRLNGTLRSSASVTFLPPDPRTNIYSNGATSTALEIDLQEVGTGLTKTIKVNFLGLAEVLNN